jgi:hydroxypyruvate isomerase
VTDRESGTGSGEPERREPGSRNLDASTSRRQFVAAGTIGLSGMATAGALRFPVPGARLPLSSAAQLKQSVARWCFQTIPLRELARSAKRIGLVGVDLLQPDEWAVVKEYGLVCSMGYPADRRDFLTAGFNDRANHRMLLNELERTIPRAAKEGVPNVIGMFGNRNGRSDAEGIAACVEGLSKIKPLAEEHGVTVCIELLNSKVDHKDYHGDRTAFGVEVMKGVASPRVKLLYDIYHMQVMEGDVIRTIRDHFAYIAHFHTAGVPGRNEIDERQELNYHAIAAAIVELGFTGYIAHEFIPKRDPMASLQAAYDVVST